MTVEQKIKNAIQVSQRTSEHVTIDVAGSTDDALDFCRYYDCDYSSSEYDVCSDGSVDIWGVHSLYREWSVTIQPST